MTKIHYFPRYSQPENFMTNNTLLLLYRLYDTSRLKFEIFLAELLSSGDADASAAPELGLQFSQQTGTSSTVLDGALYQDRFRIAIETKLDAKSFRYDQLLGHLTTFKEGEAGWLLLLSPNYPQIQGRNWVDLLNEAMHRNITLIPLTFQNIIDAFRKSLMLHDEELQTLLADYEDFCSAENLLPNDQWTIFVPPCGRSFETNKKYNLYFCPASWSRRKGRFLGIYNWKSVRLIGEIVKIVEYDVTLGANILGAPDISPEEEQRIRNSAYDFDLEGIYQFYICDRLLETNFEKISPGGIMGHRYIDIRSHIKDFRYESLEKLAQDLMLAKWGIPHRPQ